MPYLKQRFKAYGHFSLSRHLPSIAALAGGLGAMPCDCQFATGRALADDRTASLHFTAVCQQDDDDDDDDEECEAGMTRMSR